MLDILCTIGLYLLDALLDTGLVLLFFASFLLVAMLLQFITVLITKQGYEIVGVRPWLIISCPGVAVHELGHALFCIIFFHKITEIKLFTLSHGDTLGYVSHSYNPDSFYQNLGNFFIGIGPIILGVTLLSWLTTDLIHTPFTLNFDSSYTSIWDLISHALMAALTMLGEVFTLDFFLQWEALLWFVALILIGSNITLSKPDIEGASEGASFIVTIFLLYNLVLVKFAPLSETVLQFLGTTMAVTLSFLLLIAFLLIIAWLGIYLTRCAIRAIKFRKYPFKLAAEAIFLGKRGEFKLAYWDVRTGAKAIKDFDFETQLMLIEAVALDLEENGDEIDWHYDDDEPEASEPAPAEPARQEVAVFACEAYQLTDRVQEDNITISV